MTARVQNAGLIRITTALLTLSWFFGWGTGIAASASANDVAMPAPEARVLATAALGTVTVTNDTLTIAAKLTATDVRTISEFGVFDAATSGDMDLYVELAGLINLKAGDSIVFTLNLSFS